MNALFPNALYTIHKGQSGGRGLSPRLWAHVHGSALSPDGNQNAFMFYDDFLNFSGFSPAISGTTALPSTTVPGPAGYKLYADTATSACGIAPLATESGGVTQLSVGATDNHEVWLQSGNNFGAISDTAGSDKLTIFEARVRFTQVADNANAVFVGLAEEGLNAADTKADNTGVMASKDFIGFNTVQADGDSLLFSYRKAGQTQQDVLTYGTALSAATWYKFGFVYNPKAPESKRISVFVDNEEQSTYVTATNIAAATFPDGEELGLLTGMKTGGATAASFDLDWVAFYQEG